MKKLIGLLTLVLLVGCNTPCSDPGSIASLLSNQIAATWQCSADQVLIDVSAACAAHGLCAQAGKKGGAIANVACPIIVSSLQSLAQGQIPPNWQCNDVGADLSTSLLFLCEKLPI